jgi:hypothetical protein
MGWSEPGHGVKWVLWRSVTAPRRLAAHSLLARVAAELRAGIARAGPPVRNRAWGSAGVGGLLAGVGEIHAGIGEKKSGAASPRAPGGTHYQRLSFSVMAAIQGPQKGPSNERPWMERRGRCRIGDLRAAN